jgi:predicted nucleic acid-binding protein
MALIVDASVAIKWFIDEPGSDVARRLWRDEPDLLAPDLIVAQVCNAAWRKVRLGQSNSAQAKAIAARLHRGVLQLRSSAPLASRPSSSPSPSTTRFTTVSILPWPKRNRSG